MIGIIGGNGVAATNRLCYLVEKQVTFTGAKFDNDHPEMVIHQATHVPSRSLFLEGRGPSFVPEYIAIGKKLRNFGAGSICIVCNTAHYALGEISDAVGLPFMDIVRSTLIAAKEKGAKRLGLLASTGCLLGNVYGSRRDSVFDSHYGPKIISPDKVMQENVSAGIRAVKYGDSLFAAQVFSTACQQLVLEFEVDLIILGCTDISSVFSPSTFLGVGVIDSLEVAAREVFNAKEYW